MAKRWQDMEEKIDEMRRGRTHGDPKERDRERLSWRERDNKNAQSKHTEQWKDGRDVKRPEKDRYASAQAQKALKGQLEDLFRDKKGDSLRSAILEAEDRASLQSAIDGWIEARGSLPSDDADVLEKCLDARRDPTLRLVVKAIGEGLADFPADTKKMLVLKMRAKGRRTFDNKLGKMIAALLAEHGVED